jgi:hypothetical protein
MATTAGDLITAAFNKVGVYNPTSNQTASALISLNNMMGTWGPEGILTSVTRENFTLTVGDAEYTIGPSGDFNTVRPSRIENAFLRDSEGYDTPLDIIAGKDWNSVSSKSYDGQPSAIYFIPEVTLAKIIFDCEPDYAYGFYIESTKPFTDFTATTTTVTLPSEYREAIVYNLALSLAEDWDRIVSKSVQNKADETRYLLSAVNASTRPVPKAKFDLFLGSTYNINTDE